MNTPTTPPPADGPARPKMSNWDCTSAASRAAFKAFDGLHDDAPDFAVKQADFYHAAREAGTGHFATAVMVHQAAFAEMDAAHDEALAMHSEWNEERRAVAELASLPPIASILPETTDAASVSETLGTPWHEFPGSVHVIAELPDDSGAAYAARVPDATKRAYIIAAVNACAAAGLSLDDLARGLAPLCEKQRQLCYEQFKGFYEPTDSLSTLHDYILHAPLATEADVLRDDGDEVPVSLGLGAEPDDALRATAGPDGALPGYGELCEGRR